MLSDTLPFVLVDHRETLNFLDFASDFWILLSSILIFIFLCSTQYNSYDKQKKLLNHGIHCNFLPKDIFELCVEKNDAISSKSTYYTHQLY